MAPAGAIRISRGKIMRSDFLEVALPIMSAGTLALLLTAAWAGEPAGAPAVLIAKGDQLWLAGKLDEAQKIFEQAVKTDPRATEAYLKLGGLQLSRNDFTGSIQTYQHVIGLEPKNVRAWMGLGIAYLHTGKNELSRSAFDEAIKMEPARKEQLEPLIAKLNFPD